jgi:hypothetical protein
MQVLQCCSFIAGMVLHMKNALRCSFGRRPTPERRLIAGPTPDVTIRKDCVYLCVEMLEEQG